jgi:hypothetical protein
MPKVTRKCHPEAQPKDQANEREILRFAQNDSFAVTLAHFNHFQRFFMVPDATEYRQSTSYLNHQPVDYSCRLNQ